MRSIIVDPESHANGKLAKLCRDQPIAFADADDVAPFWIIARNRHLRCITMGLHTFTNGERTRPWHPICHPPKSPIWYPCMLRELWVVRHDPARAALVDKLRGLKFYGLDPIPERSHRPGGTALDAAVPIFSQLLKAELAKREFPSVAYQFGAARLPSNKKRPGSTSSREE